VLLDDIALYLETQGVGTCGTDIFAGTMPSQPNNCIVLYEYAGYPRYLVWNGERPGLQVRVRNTSYSAGRTKIEEVVQTLHGVCEYTAPSGVRYLLIRAEQSPESLGQDDNGRFEWVVNFDVIKERHSI